MALVAFDLDNTLGYFKHIAPWGHCFSLETLENSFNLILNPQFQISVSLRAKLAAAEKKFGKKILENREIMKTILRPNLASLLDPIIAAKQSGKVKAVVIYSNSWSTYTLCFAKDILEELYSCPGLFDCLVDSSHYIRKPEYKKRPEYESCFKTYKVLKSIFKELCGVEHVTPSQILFVDERIESHEIIDHVDKGLVYMKPTIFRPVISDSVKRAIYTIGREAIEPLTTDEEFLKSDICYAIKYGPSNTYIPIEGIEQLIEYIKVCIQESDKKAAVRFIDDSEKIDKELAEFLGRFN